MISLSNLNSKAARPKLHMKPKQVPNFSFEAIKLADSCAREIWVGNVYKKNNSLLAATIEIEEVDQFGVITPHQHFTVASDEVFLHLFAPSKYA